MGLLKELQEVFIYFWDMYLMEYRLNVIYDCDWFLMEMDQYVNQIIG